VEAELEKLRKDRRILPTGEDELSRWYAKLSQKSFTQSADYPQHIERLELWRGEVPGTSTPLVVMAAAYIKFAWEARGGGYANTVTPEGWRLFGERIDIAHELLNEALLMEIKDPEVYCQLLVVAKAKGLPVEQARGWVEAGRKIDPTYFKLYRNMTGYLLPKWSGQSGDIEEFASEVARDVGGDNGLLAVAHIAWEVHNAERLNIDPLFWGKFDRGLLAQAGEKCAQTYPESPYLIELGALCAVAAQDHSLARRLQPAVAAWA
jgi:hypothetical protein